MYNLEGKVALVTGAGGQRGMGRAIATRLAQEGADVIVNDIAPNPYADRSDDWGGIAQVAQEIEALGRQAMPVTADVSDAPQVREMVQQGLSRFGHIDILVNNAGSRPGKDRVPVVELEEAAFDEVQRVNVKGTFLCSQAVAREMIQRGQGGKDHHHLVRGRKAWSGALCGLLRLQVRSHRLHPILGLGIGSPQASTSTPSAQASWTPSARSTSPPP